MARAVHYPVTGSEAEWADAVLALDQLVIEGFRDGPLKKMAIEMGRTIEKEWRSLKLMEECLVGKGVADDEAKAVINALRRVRDLRTTVKGHAALRKKADAAPMPDTAKEIDTSIRLTEGAVEVDATLVARGLNVPVVQFVAEMRPALSTARASAVSVRTRAASA